MPQDSAGQLAMLTSCLFYLLIAIGIWGWTNFH